jgi:hypothetical protein
MAATSAGSARAAARLARRLGLDANPLRRATDRVEAWIRISVLAAFLMAGPIAAIAAWSATYQAGLSESRAQTAHWHSVRAVLLYPAPTVAGLAWAAGDNLAWVKARWTWPAGASRTGQVLAPMGTPAGRSLTIWVNSAGAFTDPPLLARQVTERASAAAALAPLVLGVVLLTGLCLAEALLDRRRITGWDTAWLKADSRWTSRGP